MDDVEEVIEHTKREEITFTLVRASLPHTRLSTPSQCKLSWAM